MRTIVVLWIALFSLIGTAQTIWDGPVMTFTKENGADWTQAENQDRITENVWITRANIRGIFNIAVEGSYQENLSPSGTAWAFGTTDQLDELKFEPWQLAIDNTPPLSVDLPLVLHLIEDDIYIDLTFLSWQQAGNGGGFSYSRTTDPTLSANTIQDQSAFQIFPNPSTGLIRIVGGTKGEQLQIYNLLGELVLKTTLGNSEKLNLEFLPAGIYLLRSENHPILKLVLQ